MRRPVRAEASATACSSSGVHHCTAAGPYCTSKVSLAQADAIASTSAICSATGSGVRMKRRSISSRASDGQRREDRLGRPIDQRIAVPQRGREADAHADIVRRARDVLRLGHVVGQTLRARVVHHHAAGAAERGARERHGGREIRIDRGQQREPVQPDLQRLAGGAERAGARRARVVVRVGERRQGEQRLGRAADGLDRRRCARRRCGSCWSRTAADVAAVRTWVQSMSRILASPHPEERMRRERELWRLEGWPQAPVPLAIVRDAPLGGAPQDEAARSVRHAGSIRSAFAGRNARLNTSSTFGDFGSS